MSNDKANKPGAKPSGPAPGKPAAQTSGPVEPAKPPPPSPPPVPKVAPLFRRIDWLTFLITFVVVMTGYYLTMAPELTLEDSGELATGSFYAGIPHPPGYPVWTVYTYFWTLLPIKNIAWRVALGEAVGGALAAGLLGLLVSRGSSLLVEGIEELKAMGGKWENALCMISGFVAGMLIGFNGFMWSQSVIVEVYAFSVASFMVVLICLLRWIYAPHQYRYFFWAMFFHGICFTNHQTLIVSALGIEVAVAAASFRMGRQLFLGNSIIYIGGLILKEGHVLTALEANPAILTIFHCVGISSIVASGLFLFLTRQKFGELVYGSFEVGFLISLAITISVGGDLRLLFELLAGASLLGMVISGFGVLTPTRAKELYRDLLYTTFWLLAASSIAIPSESGWRTFSRVLALGAAGGFGYLAYLTWRQGWEWLAVLIAGFCWIAGALFYFYMPLAGMTNPPMEWGYPRTVEGFIHAFTRGQYEKTNPSNVFGDPFHFLGQLHRLWDGIKEEFNLVYFFLALVPFAFFLKLHRRERAWLIGVTAIYLCMGVLLMILLNPPPDKQAQQLVRVFFTASHVPISLLVGYGMTLVAAYMATHYQRFRPWGLIGGGVAIALALYSFVQNTQDTFFGQDATVPISALMHFVGKALTNKDQYAVPVFAGLLLIGMTVAFVVSLVVYKNRAPLALTLAVFAIMPLHSIMTHWSDNEQRGHWFGYWFGHDMFTPPFKGKDGKPLYPEMTKDTVLFGGTDPGRFCPTYMIFCDSFIPPKCQPAEDPNFDRRDVYLITQNALADPTYLMYIRAQYNRSTQKDPPFFQELFRSQEERERNYTTNALARAVAPLDKYFMGLGDRIEKRRRTFTSWFVPEHFTDLPGFTAKLKNQQETVSKYLYDNLTPETQKLISGGGSDKALREALTRDLNVLLDRELEAKKQKAAKQKEKDELEQAGKKPERRQQLEKEITDLSKVGPLYDPDRFKDVQISQYLQDFIKENPQSHTRIRLNRLLLEAAYPKEIAKTKGGVYPDREIYTPTPDDSARCFQEYLADANRRLQHDQQFPNEPRQIKPGEDVHVVGEGAQQRVQVSGQVAVMSINGLLTKVIFDHNPKNEFFVEESFPLEWMYPYLTPFGIIMKINRNPLPELSQDIVDRDHEFWKQFSKRLTGDIVDYDTPVKTIADWVEKTYLRRDFSGFTGDRRFVRDDQGQKAFSKLRSSIGGIYAWRLTQDPNPNSKNPLVQARMAKEAEFAFKQAFAFCPYSPEAVFRYVNLLLGERRFDDALLIGETCLKLDPYNGQMMDLVKHLRSYKQAEMGAAAQTTDIAELERKARENPADFQAAFNLASAYVQVQQTGKGIDALDRVVNHPAVNVMALRSLARAFADLGHTNGLQQVAAKLDGFIKANPNDFDARIGLSETYRRLHQNAAAELALEPILNDPKIDPNTLRYVAQEYNEMHDYQKLEQALEKYANAATGSAEAWYDLGALKAALGKPSDAVTSLRHALDISAARRKTNATAPDLLATVQQDPRFAMLRTNPDFIQLTAPK